MWPKLLIKLPYKKMMLLRCTSSLTYTQVETTCNDNMLYRYPYRWYMTFMRTTYLDTAPLTGRPS